MRPPVFSPFIYACFMALALPAYAQAGAFGGTGGLLMAEGLAVRPLGAAFAFTALADDESSLHVNPAGLARLNGAALSGGHVVGLLDTRLSYLDLAWGRRESAAVGLQAAYTGESDVRRDAFGNNIGTFDNRQLLLGLGLAKELASGWRLGAQAKALREDFGGAASSGFAGDLGVQGPLARGWRFGAAVLNAGQQGASTAGAPSYSTPLRLQAGVAVPFFSPAWKVEADLQQLPIEQQTRLLLGTELKLDLSDAVLSLRLGSQTGLAKAEDARFTLGAGVALRPNYSLDYALASLGALGLTHRFSLGLRFESKPDLGPPAGDLNAPFSIHIVEQYDGLLITWSDPNEAVAGYNLYSDYGVVVERLNAKPVSGRQQKFIKVTKSRTYNFYVRPVGSDGKEGPPSEVAVWVSK
jgi:hypothetical protein